MICTVLKTLCFALAASVACGQGNACKNRCTRQKLISEDACKTVCDDCVRDAQKPGDVNKCFNNYIKGQKDQQVKPGADKAAEAKQACSSISNMKQRRACFQTEASKLTKPTASSTDEERRAAYANLREFEKEYLKSEMTRKIDDLKTNLLKSDISEADLKQGKRQMCEACVSGAEAEERMKDLNDRDRRAAIKVCIDECVKRTLKDLEAKDLGECVDTTSKTRMQNAQCFCQAKADDAQRMRLSGAKGARKSKGATNYMCGIYMKCAENEEIDCEDKLNELLMASKDGCNTGGKQEIRATLPQIMDMCQQKQVDESASQCKLGLTDGTAKDVRQCIQDTTGLTRGKVKNLARKALQKKMRDEYLTCKKCDQTTSSDCPDEDQCKTIARNAILAELGSACEGNYKTLVEDGLTMAEKETDDDDEIVQVARKACKVMIRFKKGRGACRASGLMQAALERKMGMEGAKVDGVMGLAKGEMSKQTESMENGEMVQDVEMTYTVLTRASSLAEPEPQPEPEPESDDMSDQEKIEQKCMKLVTKLMEASTGGRRLAELQAGDVDEVDSTQATESCLASNTTCQESELETEEDTGDDTTTTDTSSMESTSMDSTIASTSMDTTVASTSMDTTVASTSMDTTIASSSDTTTTPMDTTIASSTDTTTTQSQTTQNQGSTSIAAGGSTSVGATPNPGPDHTVNIQVTLTDISAVADEATLIAQIKAGLKAAAGASESVSVEDVVIQFINVVSVYKGLSQIVVNAIIEAYVAMTSIARSMVKVNDQAHSGDASRRLQQVATVKAKVEKTGDDDVVAASQVVAQATTLSGMTTALAATASYDVGSLSSLTLDPVTTELSITSKVKGTAAAPTAADIITQLANSITTGGATVTGATVTNLDMGATTTGLAAVEKTSFAHVTSLIPVWAIICCALLIR